MWLQLREFNSLRSPHLMKGVRLVESRQPLKLASGVRFAHPLPLAAGAIGGAPRSERGGSRFEAWAASQSFTRASSKGQDGTLRTYKSGFDSSCPYQVFGRSSNRTGRSAPNAEIGVGIPTGRPGFAVMTERLRHLIVDQDEVGSTPIHRAKFPRPSSNGRISGSQPEDASSTLAGPAMGVSSNWPGSLSFKQRMRDHDPPPLPVFGL